MGPDAAERLKIVCRLGRWPVTYEEMEKSLVALRDNQVVQGEILNRLELAVERLADGFLLLQAAMKGLAETVDRFIKGLETNGHLGRS